MSMPLLDCKIALNEMQTTTDSAIETVIDSANGQEVQFGNGRYSKVMAELYRDAKNYLVDCDTNAKAERLAKSFGAEMGRLSAAQVKEIKFGKIGKNGDINLKEVCDSLKFIASPAISIAKIITILEDARKAGMTYKDSKVTLNENLTEWLNESK